MATVYCLLNSGPCLSAEAWAGWAQTGGGMLAVWAAFKVGAWQTRAQLDAERRRRGEALRLKILLLKQLLDSGVATMAQLEVNPRREGGKGSMHETSRLVEALTGLHTPKFDDAQTIEEMDAIVDAKGAASTLALIAGPGPPPDQVRDDVTAAFTKLRQSIVVLQRLESST